MGSLSSPFGWHLKRGQTCGTEPFPYQFYSNFKNRHQNWIAGHLVGVRELENSCEKRKSVYLAQGGGENPQVFISTLLDVWLCVCYQFGKVFIPYHFRYFFHSLFFFQHFNGTYAIIFHIIPQTFYVLFFFKNDFLFAFQFGKFLLICLQVHWFFLCQYRLLTSLSKLLCIFVNCVSDF